jgi:hypothetical protein
MEDNYGLEYMSDMIAKYHLKDNCDYNVNCMDCSDIEECYNIASDRCNSEYAKSINYGGYGSEKAFWEMLFS